MNSVSDQIKSLLLFHNHLFHHEENLVSDGCGVQSESVLSGDPTFNIIDNKYDIPSFKRICAEFNRF